MSWLGGSLGMMWSIVQSLPSSVLLHVEQMGSRTVFAYALAFTHSFDWCHSAIQVDYFGCELHDVFVDCVFLHAV